jgi:hypothetical protein
VYRMDIPRIVPYNTVGFSHTVQARAMVRAMQIRPVLGVESALKASVLLRAKLQSLHETLYAVV